MAATRRNSVIENGAIGIAGVFGVVALLHAPDPLPDRVGSQVLVGLCVAAVAWASASAPWWSVTLAAGAASAFAGDIVLALVAGVAALMGLTIGLLRRDLAELRVVAAGVALNVLAEADVTLFFGASSVVAITVGMGLTFLGLRRRPSKIRRPAYAAAGAVAAIAALATIGFGLSAMSARSDLEAGRQQARSGIVALNRGDFDAAASHFEASQRAMERALSDLSRPWAMPAQLVPVVAQHHEAVTTVARAGDDSTTTVAHSLSMIDPGAVRLVNGRIDLASVTAFESPLVAVQDSLRSLREVLVDVRSPWVLDRASDELAQLDNELANHAPKLGNAISAVRLAPGLLGGEEIRHYLVLFTTPAEARGLGGFTGNYAELRVADGRISMPRFGRVSELEQRGLAQGARVTDVPSFLGRYALFGYSNGGKGYASSAAWRNLTISPHFPDVAKVASELYPQSGGRPIDGVIALDPYVLQAMLKYTGPIDLESVDRMLNAQNAADYLLTGQYAVATDRAQRADALEDAAETTFNELLDGSLPDPATLARDLGPLATERRLLVWTDDAHEQKALRQIGLLGNVPALAGADGYSVAVTNAGGSKIDTFLERRFSYSSDIDPDTGITSATLQVDLTNSAPPSGLPRYVIGNLVDLPPGTNRLYVEFYSPLSLQGARLDGEPVGLDLGRHKQWNVYSTFVNIAAGGTATFELELRGQLERPHELVTWVQPLAIPAEIVPSHDTAPATSDG